MDSYSQSLDHKVKALLARAIELTEKMQNALEAQSHGEDVSERLEELSAARAKLFEQAEDEVNEWLARVKLTAVEPWLLYKTFLVSLEETHLDAVYAARNAASETPTKVNPFLMRIEDEALPEKATVGKNIDARRLTKADILEMLSNVPLEKVEELLRLAMGLQDGTVWERKYDL